MGKLTNSKEGPSIEVRFAVALSDVPLKKRTAASGTKDSDPHVVPVQSWPPTPPSRCVLRHGVFFKCHPRLLWSRWVGVHVAPPQTLRPFHPPPRPPSSPPLLPFNNLTDQDEFLTAHPTLSVHPAKSTSLLHVLSAAAGRPLDALKDELSSYLVRHDHPRSFPTHPCLCTSCRCVVHDDDHDGNLLRHLADIQRRRICKVDWRGNPIYHSTCCPTYQRARHRIEVQTRTAGTGGRRGQEILRLGFV